MSYKKFISFSSRNLLYTDSAGGGGGTVPAALLDTPQYNLCVEPVVRVILEDSIRRDIRPEVSVTLAVLAGPDACSKSYLNKQNFIMCHFCNRSPPAKCTSRLNKDESFCLNNKNTYQQCLKPILPVYYLSHE